MNYLVFFGIIETFFLVVLVLKKKNRMLADLFLAGSLIITGFQLISFHLYRIDFGLTFPILYVISFGLPLLHGPFTYFYIDIITKQKQTFKRINYLHFSPYLVFLFLLLVVYTNFDSSNDVTFLNHLEQNHYALIVTLILFNTILGPSYTIYNIYLLRVHQHKIGKRFSYTEGINLNWLKYILYINVFVWLVASIVATVSSTSEIVHSGFPLDIMYVTLTIAVFFIGFFGVKQQVIYKLTPSTPTTNKATKSTKSIPVEAPVPYQKSGLKKEESELILNNLLNYMETESPYLNGRLSLKEVAVYLKVSTNHLSQVINESLGKNFFDFVNGYRVNLVKAKLKDPANKNYTILAIALECGFNSKSSFNAIFKKFIGKTPSEYIEAVNNRE
jgi:AraC-like DNA-binding protein